MNFIDREKELETLNKEYKKDNSFVVLYGRRRVGKTTLIKEFIKDKKAFPDFFLKSLPINKPQRYLKKSVQARY